MGTSVKFIFDIRWQQEAINLNSWKCSPSNIDYGNFRKPHIQDYMAAAYCKFEYTIEPYNIKYRNTVTSILDAKIQIYRLVCICNIKYELYKITN